MQHTDDPGRSADTRAKPRTNIFLAAVLQGVGFSAPVKIRNMSADGALIEGAAVPPAGMAVRLLRGSLGVTAHVAWSTERRCGLRFSSLVCVDDWLAPAGRQEQKRVDDLVRVLKAGAVPLVAPPQAGTTTACNQLAAAEMGEALLQVSQLIESLGENLAGDHTILARHGDQLIDLDIALQTIRAVAGILVSKEGGPAMLSRFENLRKSYAEALLRRA